MPQKPLILNALLRQTAAQTQLPLLELRMLLEKATGLNKTQQLVDRDKILSAVDESCFMALVERRQAGVPMAYIVGHKEFFSRPFVVDERVLIPRPETEELVELALDFLQTRLPTQVLTRVLDVGTGSGAIAITLALECPLLSVYASDISARALEVAAHNAQVLGANTIQFLRGNLLAAVPSAAHGGPEPLKFDLIVSNPPYIAAGDPHLEQGDLRFEPAVALTDHADGLSHYRRLAAQALAHLRPGGAVLVEHGYNQQEAIVELFKKTGFAQVLGMADLAGTPRFVMARATLFSHS